MAMEHRFPTHQEVSKVIIHLVTLIGETLASG